jgi:hypothetical protein
MASHPTFNPNHLDDIGAQLNRDPEKPLINRAVQGVYPTGTLLEPFAQALFGETEMSQADLAMVNETFGFDTPPQLGFVAAVPSLSPDSQELHISPLQAAIAAAALSSHGSLPAPRISISVNTPRMGWVILPALGDSFEAVQPDDADEAARAYISEGRNIWSHTGRATGEESPVTWFIAGTPPNWQATPLVVVVLLEEDNERLAQFIGQELLTDAMNP